MFFVGLRKMVIAVFIGDIVKVVVKFRVKCRAPCLNARNAYRSWRKPVIFVRVIGRVDLKILIENPR